MRGHKYEQTDQGLYFPKARVNVIGEYSFDTNGRDPGTSLNLVTVEGFNHMLAVSLGGAAQNPSWYLSLFSGAYTPVPSLTAATYPSAATEIVSATEGYSENLRQVWTQGTPTAGAADNLAAKAAFTIRTATSVTVRGAALSSQSIKGSASGVLLSVARFGVDRVHYDGDIFNLGYRVRLQTT